MSLPINNISLTIIPSSTTSTTLPAAPFRPPPPTPSEHSTLEISRRRTTVVLVSFITAPLLLTVSSPPAASAFSLGISGPKDWLKEQKKKSSRYLLAPIDASRNSLRSAYLLLTKGETEFGENDLEEVRKLITSAARDCVVQDRNAFVAFQANTGVEVCTFRLILKNAASLLGDKDPIKLEAEAKLTDMLRSLASLSDITNEISAPVSDNRQKVASALTDALYSLDNFEQGIKDCLEI
ncbi:OLC1v1017985C1 [Oldenlandia corymbosa var. corymbosa]|uniref:OLC1v1017985C1 n=1 Tax=Oldenlandia corymbosa var. corymbosa TaxID=529605 RepID=A0AAV1EAK5_OLDCO|nr:OLC1v1017985C1 [Oldenlandia corymbosa var. corymbosa]